MTSRNKSPQYGPAAQLKAARAALDSPLEARFARDMRALDFPRWQRNYRFVPDRKLEIDFAWPELRFGVEVQGAVHAMHLHRDAEKAALALLNHWTILPVTGQHVRNGRAIHWAKELLARAQAGTA